MGRARISTTVDHDLLARARRSRAWASQAALFDAALEALLSSQRAAEVDVSYEAYDEHPFDAPDEWGDLASWGEAASRS